MGKSSMVLLLGAAFILAAPCAPRSDIALARTEAAQPEVAAVQRGYERSVRVPPSYGFVASGTIAFVSSR